MTTGAHFILETSANIASYETGAVRSRGKHGPSKPFGSNATSALGGLRLGEGSGRPSLRAGRWGLRELGHLLGAGLSSFDVDVASAGSCILTN